MPGKDYRCVYGKVVDQVEHKFEESELYLDVRFTDKTALYWRIGTSLAIAEADLGAGFV